MRCRALYLTLLLLALCLNSCQSCQAQQAQVTSDSYTYKKPASGGTGKVYMGREIAAIMTSSGGNWLDRDTRQEEENSALMLENMRLQPTSVIADIGAGTGFYTFQIAPRVPQGTVYAVEVQDRFVKALKDRIEKTGTTNVSVIEGDSQRVNLPAGAVDMALMVDVYHELSFPREILQSIHSALKPEGKLLLLEYKAEDPSVRIRPLHKMSADQIKRELEANGFILERREDTLPLQHFMLFRKATP